MKKYSKLRSIPPFLIALMLIVVQGYSSIYAHSTASEQTSVDKETVVLLHGLGRSKTAMWLLASRLEDEGFHVENIGYSSLTQAPSEILDEIGRQIDDCCIESQNTVHFVGHSLGGLLIRAYLQERKPENLGNVVLIGTPNKGVEAVDIYRDRWWLKLIGPTAIALGTDSNSFPNTLEQPYYPVGVIAGVSGDDDNDHILPGIDDGLVTVESTKLENMTDFAIVDSSHTYMRYDEDVARLTVDFLRHATFQANSI